MAKPQITPETIKNKIQVTVDKTGVTTFGDVNKFTYDANKPIKCEFNLILDHTVWSKFSELSEELSTSPTLLLYMLMEQTLLTTGKLQEGWKDSRNDGEENPPAPVVVQVKDLEEDKDGKFLSLGQNRVLGIPEERRTRRPHGNSKKETEEEILEMNFLAELND